VEFGLWSCYKFNYVFLHSYTISKYVWWVVGELFVKFSVCCCIIIIFVIFGYCGLVGWCVAVGNRYTISLHLLLYNFVYVVLRLRVLITIYVCYIIVMLP